MALIAEPDSATAGAHTAAAGTIPLGGLCVCVCFIHKLYWRGRKDGSLWLETLAVLIENWVWAEIVTACL